MKVRMPQPEELNDYYKTYLKYLRTDDLLESLIRQNETTKLFYSAVTKEKETLRYAQGKWSVREVAGHLCDSERIMTYRALCLARNDQTHLPGFDENAYTANSNYHQQSLHDIACQQEIARESGILMFKTFTEEMYNRKGIANNAPVTVRAILFFLIAHQEHHLKVIKERYLG